VEADRDERKYRRRFDFHGRRKNLGDLVIAKPG
jgi:hypothetical protein